MINVRTNEAKVSAPILMTVNAVSISDIMGNLSVNKLNVEPPQ